MPEAIDLTMKGTTPEYEPDIEVVYLLENEIKDITGVLTTTTILWRPHHDHVVFISGFRVHHHGRRYPELANTTPNVYCALCIRMII